ncbi:MAG: UDP-glucose 4-epimerase GalE [Oscillospiraceae bacterium]|jgi:UDP-glucose 4-epimerase|nr:UDP-glucose 4-epimerase GalE [Oscillospiraceae bacterium]
MTILVTGGTGYIGSHTAVLLLQNGYDVVIMDNLCNSKEEAVNRIQEITGKRPAFYHTDMMDMEGMRAIFRAHKIDAVIHFAGLKAVGESVQQPMRYYYNNITGSLQLFQVMEEFGVRTIVFSSSATVYGMNNPVPYVEGMPTSATNPYGYTKLMIEQILMDIHKANPSWNVVLLRYFNPIGAHESGLLGEDPNGIPNNLMPYIMQVAVGKLPCLNVYGSDYDTPDGTGVRDYIHVMDLADGHLKALDYIHNHPGLEIFNLGTGSGTSVLEIVSAFEKASGQRIPYQIAPRRAGDIACFYADNARAANLLHWKANYTIADMCRDSWNFIHKNPNGL